jgi:transitional endoplasmic reticulum ATPase
MVSIAPWVVYMLYVHVGPAPSFDHWPQLLSIILLHATTLFAISACCMHYDQVKVWALAVTFIGTLQSGMDVPWTDMPEVYAIVILSVPMAAIAALRWLAMPRTDIQRSRSGSPELPAYDEYPDMTDDVEETLQPIRFKAVRVRENFSTLEGMLEVKAKLFRIAAEIQNSPADEAPRNGILLHGEPGTGKTCLATAFAGELGRPLIKFVAGEITSQWVGEKTTAIVKVFDDARRQQPCVLFIDEINSLLVDRAKVLQVESEAVTATDTMLKKLEDIRAENVIVIGATNFLDKCDPAAVREGRFDYKVEVPPPDFAARRAIFEASLARNMKSGHVLSEKVGDRLAERWEGFSAARIKAIGHELASGMLATGETEVTFQLAQAALRTVQGRKGRLPENTPALADLVMSPALRKRVSALALRMTDIYEIEDLGGSVPRGVLLFGPPGTGKTVTVRALAKETAWGFIKTTGADILSDPEKLKAITCEASDIRPCIVFIDEADDILADRNGYRSTSPSGTNKLLDVIDGAEGRVPDLMFIAATNLPDLMDEAALRGGRFTEKIEFALPALPETVQFVGAWAKSVRLRLATDMTVLKVSRRLQNLAYANLQETLQQAVNIAVARKLRGERGEITLLDIDEAYDSVVRDSQNGRPQTAQQGGFLAKQA